ncbi:hypothetical protein IJ596_00925, partial [bacterium]|nr:hypothetical protein [bacterium]
ISGYSDNDETIAMLNAIPNSKLKDVARAYRKNNSHGLLEDFGREFMVDRKEVCDLAKRMKEPSSDKRYYELYVKVYNPDRRDIWDYAELKEMDDIICAEDND